MKTLLITGGTGKIGGQLTAHFLKKDWQVITTTRKRSNLHKLVDRELIDAEQLRQITAIEVDFENPDAVQNIMAFFAEHPHLYPEVLVNNARSLKTLKVETNGWSKPSNLLREYLIDVVVPYELSMHLSTVQDSPLKSIINISSIYGIVPFNPNLYTNYEASAPIQYSLAKSAVIQLTKELAIRLSKKQIKVNTVSYGGVQGRQDTAFEARYAQLCPQGSMLTEEQTIGPVDFLASSNSDGITGQNLIQDGGWTCW